MNFSVLTQLLEGRLGNPIKDQGHHFSHMTTMFDPGRDVIVLYTHSHAISKGHTYPLGLLYYYHFILRT